jgi:hypothetical protein
MFAHYLVDISETSEQLHLPPLIHLASLPTLDFTNIQFASQMAFSVVITVRLLFAIKKKSDFG